MIRSHSQGTEERTAGTDLLFLIAVVTIALSAIPAGNTQGLERNFILIGQVFSHECPVPGWLNKEPSFSFILIPTDTDQMALSAEDARRYVRQYFPRTKSALFEGYHFVVMPDTNIDPFTSKQIAWLEEAFREHGMGAFMSVGADVSGSYQNDWINSPLHDELPVNLEDQYRVGDSFTIVIVKEEPEVLSMFRENDIEGFMGSCPCARCYPRPGSTTWADAKYTGTGLVYPWLVSWNLGVEGGMIWTVSDDLDHQWWWPGGVRMQSTNPYAGDVFLNIAFHSFGRPLPEDIELVHEIRDRFDIYETNRLLIRGVIEWADKLGANTRKAEDALGEVKDLYDEAVQNYAAGEYEQSLSSLSDAMEESKNALDIAYDTKKTAMFYIYAVEWLATTGTLLLSGSVLYTLMVRRRLYRSIETTRLVSREE